MGYLQEKCQSSNRLDAMASEVNGLRALYSGMSRHCGGFFDLQTDDGVGKQVEYKDLSCIHLRLSANV